MKTRTTQWVIDNWEWVIPLDKEFLESLPTHLIIQQLKTTSKIVISDRENIPNLTHRVRQDGRNCRVRLVFRPEEREREEPKTKPIEVTKRIQRNEFEYIEKEEETHRWLGGIIKVIKCSYTFELNKIEWYHYIVKRHNGVIIEKTKRAVSKKIVDERVAYFQGLSKERVDQIKEVLEEMEMEA